MKKNKKINLKFVANYENKIKEYRKEYYKNIINSTSPHDNKPYYIILNVVPFLLAIIIILIGRFNIYSEVVSLVLFIIVNIIIKIIFKTTSLDTTNKYLREIMKCGYYSIDDYEEKLKEYVTGPNGYYNQLLQDIMTKYNISENTRQIPGLHGEIYYIWWYNI